MTDHDLTAVAEAVGVLAPDGLPLSVRDVAGVFLALVAVYPVLVVVFLL